MPFTILLDTANSQDLVPAAKNVCKLRLATYDLSVGFTSPKLYTPSIGILKAVLVFVDFEDTPANDTIDALYDFFMPDASNWYSTASYGELKIEMQVDKSKFYRVPRLSTGYIWERNGTQ
jgi:hypothetical protein